MRLVQGMSSEQARAQIAAYLRQQLAELQFVGLEVEVEALRAWEPVHVRASQDARSAHVALSALAQALGTETGMVVCTCVFGLCGKHGMRCVQHTWCTLCGMGCVQHT